MEGVDKAKRRAVSVQYIWALLVHFLPTVTTASTVEGISTEGLTAFLPMICAVW